MGKVVLYSSYWSYKNGESYGIWRTQAPRPIEEHTAGCSRKPEKLPDIKGKRSQIRSQEAQIGSQEAQIRSQKALIRSQEAQIRSQIAQIRSQEAQNSLIRSQTRSKEAKLAHKKPKSCS